MGRASVSRSPHEKPREANQSGTSTTETAFTSDGTIPVVLDLPTAGELANTNGPTTAIFKVRAYGRVTGGTTTNFTAVLYSGTSATLSSNTAIETSGAVAVNSISTNWALETTIVWDTTSDEMHGRGWGMVDDTVTAVAALTNSPTSVDPAGDTSLGFVVSWQFSAGNASNAAVLDGFVLEVL
jgi:hypothetical protein